MAQVPYTPYPTVSPDSSPTPEVRISTPLEAFGGNIARAVEGLGKVAEHAGDELFSRAVAMQQLNNETEAKAADAKYIMESGKLHADYSSTFGQDAVTGLPKHIEALDKLRQDIRGSLSNPMAQKMYDSQSLGTMGRNVFNAAGHAATENKKYALGTAKAQMDLDAKSVEDDPQNDRLFADKLDRVRINAETVASLSGLPPGSPQAEVVSRDAISKLWSQRILGLSRTAPFEAAKMLDAHKTELNQADYLKTDQSVRGQSRAVGAANIANNVYAGGQGDDKKPEKSLQALEEEARAEAKKQDPDDPILAEHAVQALRAKYNQDKYARRQEQVENNQIVADGIQKGVPNEQALRADPKVLAAIEALPKTKQLTIPGMINRYNAARDKLTNEQNYERLYGIANNDVEAFLNTDLTQEKLSQSDMRKFMDLQRKLKDNPNQDPRVDRAKGILKGAMGAQLEALGIFKRTDANKDDYDHYTGALSVAIDAWTEEHKKPPTARDIIDTIGPQVIQQRAEPAWFGLTTSKTPFYTQTVPDKFSTQLKADMEAKGLSEPTEQQIYRAWLQVQYGKYGRAKSKSE